MKFEKIPVIRLTVSAFLIFLAIYYWESVSGLISLFFSSLTPIIIGIVVAYILNILMSFYERFYPKPKKAVFLQKSKRIVCMIAAFLTFIGIVSLIIRLVIPELVSCVTLMISEIPPAIEKLLENEFITRVLPENIIKALDSINWREYISKLFDFVTSGIGNAAGTIYVAVTSVFSTITTTFVSVIFSIYLLLGKEKLQIQFKRLMKTYLPTKANRKLLYVFHVLNDCFHKFIVGQCTEAVILGLLCVGGMLIFKFPYAVMIGTLIGFTALIPVAGAYIGAVIGAIMILTVSPIKALLFIIFIIVLQQVEGNLIYPKVVGKSIGLPAIYVLASITIGGGLMGIYGMLIGVPLASCAYRLVREDVTKRERIKKD